MPRLLDETEIPDPWVSPEQELPHELVQESYALEPWLLPSVTLNERGELPSDKQGVYFAYQGKNVLYIGKTEASGGFKARWANHHTLDVLALCQKALGTAVRIAYWSITQKQFIGEIERYLIELRQPAFNKALTSKGLRAIVNAYLGGSVTRISVAPDLKPELEAVRGELSNEVLEVSRWAVEGFTKSREALAKIGRIENWLMATGVAGCMVVCAIGPIARFNLLPALASPPATRSN